MTLEDLNLIHREANWLITKRSGLSALKSMTVGSESLEHLIDRISDLYELDSKERRRLRPTIATDIHDGLSSSNGNGKKIAGGASAAFNGKKAMSAFKAAQKSGRVSASALAFLKGGPAAAIKVATKGGVAKANPLFLGLTVGWAVGSTGWLIYQASKYNQAAYSFLIEKHRLKAAPDSGLSDR